MTNNEEAVIEVLETSINRAIELQTYYRKLIRDIQDALNTEEEGANLVTVARDAHAAEQELAAIIIRKMEEEAYERMERL